jgi:hypothetical protein
MGRKILGHMSIQDRVRDADIPPVKRARTRGFSWLRKLGIGSDGGVDPTVEEFFAARPERVVEAPERREWRASLAQALATAAAT